MSVTVRRLRACHKWRNVSRMPVMVVVIPAEIFLKYVDNVFDLVEVRKV